jgi:hypothetical protein
MRNSQPKPSLKGFKSRQYSGDISFPPASETSFRMPFLDEQERRGHELGCGVPTSSQKYCGTSINRPTYYNERIPFSLVRTANYPKIPYLQNQNEAYTNQQDIFGSYNIYENNSHIPLNINNYHLTSLGYQTECLVNMRLLLSLFRQK